MTYAVDFSRSAAKELKKLPPQVAKLLVVAINKLADDPRQGPVRQMVGGTSWRLRAGDYRIIYDIHDDKLVILILKAAHRRDVYRRK